MNIEKALVVDDSKVAHLTLRKLLTERNIQVDWVGSGEDAVAYMERQRPDVIFMDVMMPGMDGFETAAAITNNPAGGAPPIIMCSANATDEDKENASKSGAVGFLSKPYTPAEMDEILEMVRGLPAPAVAQPVSPAVEVKESSKIPEVPKPVETPPTPEEVSRPPFTPEPIEAEVSEPSAPSIAEPERVGGAMADVERIAERAAWSMADKIAREVALEVAQDKAEQTARITAEQTARTTAEQAVRKLAEDIARKAVHAAVKAAQETVSTGGGGTQNVEQVARSAADEASRAMGEQIVRKIQDNVNRGLETTRDNLAKSIEERVPHYVKDALAHAMSGQEFKQKLTKTVGEAMLPRAESSARQAALDATQDAVTAGEGARKQANLALIVAIIAMLIALGAIILPFLSL